MAIYLNKSGDIKKLAKTPMRVVEIYSPYRDGWTDNGSVKTHRSFYTFPYSDKAVIESGEELEPNDKTEIREKVWEGKKPVFKKVEQGFINKEFFATYKKVFDVKVELENPITIETYKGEQTDDTLILQAFGASKIKAMLASLTDYEPELMKGKTRTGEEAMVPVYDYEDKAKDELAGVAFKFTVAGEGLETKWTFKSSPFAKAAKTEATDSATFDDIPF